MEYLIAHETSKYLRLRARSGRFTPGQTEVLQYALADLKGISRVRLYPASGGIAISYRGGAGNRDRILRKISALQFRNVEMFARKLGDTIDREELSRRKLSPEVKRRMRGKMLAEAAMDLLMPVPVQIGYHVYQLVTLRDL